MNLRISSEQLRFRITREELAEIMCGKTIEFSSAVLTRVCRYAVQVVEQEPSLSLQESDSSLTLWVDRNALETFSAQLPSREGITHTIKNAADAPLVLVLEVDVRRRNQ